MSLLPQLIRSGVACLNKHHPTFHFKDKLQQLWIDWAACCYLTTDTSEAFIASKQFKKATTINSTPTQVAAAYVYIAFYCLHHCNHSSTANS